MFCGGMWCITICDWRGRFCWHFWRICAKFRVCGPFVEIKEPTVLGVNMFSATSLTLKPIMVTFLYWAVIQTVSFIFFQVKALSISDQLTLHFLLILPFLEHLANRNRWQTKELHIYACIYQGMPLLARPHYYCAKFMAVECNQTCPSRAARALLFASFKKGTLTWDHTAMQNKMGPNVFPNHQFRNNMFHTEIGTRNKTVPNGQFGNNLLHSEVGTWTKIVIIDQFGNNLFHWQIRTRNKTVLIYQFRNCVFHLQIGTRNKTVPIYQFGNSVLSWQIGSRNKTVLI